MFCQNCGKPIPDGANFCSGCGAAVPAREQQAPPEILETAAASESPAAGPVPEPVPEAVPVPAPPAAPAAVEAAPVQLEPLAVPKSPVAVTAVEPSSAGDGEPILGRKKGQGGKVLALLAVAAVVVIAAVFGVVKLVSGGGGGGGKPAYVYLTGDDELMFLKSLQADGEKAEITDEKSGGVQFSPEGNYIYFSRMKDGSYGDLYRMEIAKIGKEGAEPQKISSEVSYYEFLPEEQLVFLKGSGEDQQLRFFDGSEDYKLAGGVSEFTVNAEATHAYYTEAADGAYTLYRVPLAADGEKEKLVKDANRFLTPLDADPLVYSQSDGEGGSTVYTAVPGGEKEKLAGGVNEIIDLTVLDGGKVRLLYGVAEEGSDEYGATYTVYCVTSGGEKEKLASEVAQLHGWSESGGRISLVYGVLDQKAEGNSSYLLYTVTSGGEKEKIASEVDSVYAVDLDGSEASVLYTTVDAEEHTLYEFVTDSTAEADAQVQEPSYSDYETIDPYWGWYTTDWDAYYDAWEVWSQVSHREQLRQELKDTSYNILSYDLTRYDKGETTVIAEGLAAVEVLDTEHEICIYTKQEGEAKAVAELADLEYSSELYGMMGSDETPVQYVNVKGAESELDLDEDYTPNEILVLNGSQVVLRAYDKEYESALFRYTLENGKLTGGGVLTDEPFSGLTAGTAPNGKEGLYYFTDLDEKNSTGELICYTGEKITIAKDAREVLMLDGKTIFKLDEMSYDSRRETMEGSLYTVTDGQSAKVADDVDISSISILDAKQILYIGDGDLFVWNGTENTKLASDVTVFWHNQETAQYDTFTCDTEYGGVPEEEGWNEEYYGDDDWDYGSLGMGWT